MNYLRCLSDKEFLVKTSAIFAFSIYIYNVLYIFICPLFVNISRFLNILYLGFFIPEDSLPWAVTVCHRSLSKPTKSFYNNYIKNSQE